MSITIINASHVCRLCQVKDLTTELRPSTLYRLPVPICNPCWPRERRKLAHERARRRAQALARAKEALGAEPQEGRRPHAQGGQGAGADHAPRR